jgi:hypothetical protein
MRLPERTIIAAAGLLALVALLGIEGSWLMAGPGPGAFVQRDTLPAHADVMWRAMGRHD